ncbi:MAG: tetratricopeptide repeat protein [Prevotella sp.]|nr:tetratricopeptide repeat protein [Prevotella sp.]
MKETGDEYFDSEEFHEILSEYESAVDKGLPVFLDAEELTDIADYYQFCSYDEQAEQAINLALSISPGHIAPLNYKIQESLDNGDVDRAREYLEQINDTDDLDYILDKAEILIADEYPEEANDYLREKFKNISPDDYEDFVTNAVRIFSSYYCLDFARQWLARGIPKKTNSFLELKARLLYQLGEYKESVKVWSELLDADPYDKHYWYMLASTQFASEDYSSAIESCDYILAIDPEDPDGLLTKANGLYEISNYQEALKYYDRFLKVEPQDEHALTYKGLAHLNLRCYKEAIESLSKAEKHSYALSPYLLEIYEQLSFAYSEEGIYDKAIEMLDKADVLYNADKLRTKVLRGHIYLKAGKIEEARRCFRQAYVSSDTPASTLLRIIVSLYENHYLEIAYRLFKKYFKMVKDDNTEGYAYMALCCYDLKKTDEFVDNLKIACERNPDECSIALAHLFPKNVEPKDFYTYIQEKLRK